MIRFVCVFEWIDSFMLNLYHGMWQDYIRDLEKEEEEQKKIQKV